MPARAISILYVDDEANNLIAFRAVFRTKYTVFTALSGLEGLEILSENDIQIIITDQRMPNMTGVEFLEEVITKYPTPIRILLTGYTDMSAIIDAINKGSIFQYLNKPWDEEELEEVIEKAYDVYLKKIEIMEENKELAITNQQLEFLLRQKLLS
jgi:response regulator RpfG family c-di-GMP phosphodiesterase